MRLTKLDKTIIVFFLILSIAIFLFFKLTVANADDRILMIQKDSSLYATYNLDLLKENLELDIENLNRDFKILVSKDKVYVLESGCEDNICKKNIINDVGESIVCVPSKILIKIVSNNKFDIDSVAY